MALILSHTTVTEVTKLTGTVAPTFCREEEAWWPRGSGGWEPLELHVPEVKSPLDPDVPCVPVAAATRTPKSLTFSDLLRALVTVNCVCLWEQVLDPTGGLRYKRSFNASRHIQLRVQKEKRQKQEAAEPR